MNIQSITEMIALWPSRKALANDVGTPIATVHKWAQNDSIPSHWQAAFVRAARARDLPITAEDVDAAHEARRTGAA